MLQIKDLEGVRSLTYRAILALLVIAAVGCARKNHQTAADNDATAVVPSPISTNGKTETNLQVTSPDFQAGAQIPLKFSSYDANRVPLIKWTPGPVGTNSYALMLEDPDASGAEPFVHWLMVDIPSRTLQIPGAGRALPNSNGTPNYYGPHPPSGTHHYVFQVFALDVPSIQAKDRDGVLSAMKGHVLAKGELTATFTKP